MPRVVTARIRPTSERPYVRPNLSAQNTSLVNSSILSARSKRREKSREDALNASHLSIKSLEHVSVIVSESNYVPPSLPSPQQSLPPSPTIQIPPSEILHHAAKSKTIRKNNNKRLILRIAFVIFIVTGVLAAIAGTLIGTLYKPIITTTTTTSTSTTSTTSTTTTKTSEFRSEFIDLCHLKKLLHRQLRQPQHQLVNAMIFLIENTIEIIVLLLATSTSSTSSTSTTTTETTTTETTSTSETTTTTTTTESTTASCYFGGDYVHLLDGGLRQISSLKVGDRVWALSQDGQYLIDDIIMVIPHGAPQTLTEFYTFTTVENQTISLTDTHFLVIFDSQDKQMKTISASRVTLNHRLVMINRTISLKQIEIVQRIGFYSPITISGYLLVNNLSTSVYSDFFHASHDFHHNLAGPARAYYNLTRWLFGNDFHPFGTSISEELHPISKLVIVVHDFVQYVYSYLLIPLCVIAFFYLTQRKSK
ncbi:unnamed protein product [Adineta ricciae]|uniref:Hint domain-containing protein n=1 Tax=Adineta ricciae TaxID=249248 RepID=A0A815BZV4_ADIRI|nr:unnamed protein product [Adineta ricciae]